MLHFGKLSKQQVFYLLSPNRNARSFYKLIYQECVLACMWLANTVPHWITLQQKFNFCHIQLLLHWHPPLHHCCFSWSERGLRTDHELSAAHLYLWHLTSKCDLTTFMPRKSMLFSSVHPCRKRGMDCSEWHVSNVEQSKAEIDLHSMWRLADKKMTKATVIWMTVRVWIQQLYHCSVCTWVFPSHQQP